jgi:hypothetical protein
VTKFSEDLQCQTAFISNDGRALHCQAGMLDVYFFPHTSGNVQCVVYGEDCKLQDAQLWSVRDVVGTLWSEVFVSLELGEDLVKPVEPSAHDVNIRDSDPLR